MGQGTSRLNWVCSHENGKFNLSATYEEHKFSPTEIAGAGPEKIQKSKEANTQPNDPCQKISTSKDTLLPIMDVESSTDGPNRSIKLRRTFSSCDLVYTKPAVDARRLLSGYSGAVNKNGRHYQSHEVLSSGANSSTNTESSGLSPTNSENSLSSTKSVDSKLHHLFGLSNTHKTKREQADQLNKQTPNNSMTPIQHSSLERKLNVSSTSIVSTDRESSVGDISSLSELLRKKKKDARRAEIVAAVTNRLYSAKKKMETKTESTEAVQKGQHNQDDDDDAEPDELKLCQRARARLQELSKKALHAHRSRVRQFSDSETQTDFDNHVLRVKEVAVSTEDHYCSPHMYSTENIGPQFTGYAYPSMRQCPAWSSLSVGNYNKFPNEDNFSDDSLDSIHGLENTEEKTSLWNSISISSGKQFNINGVCSQSNEMCRNISTQTQACSHQQDITSFVQNELDMEPTHFSMCSTNITSPRQVDMSRHECTNQPGEAFKFIQPPICLHKESQQQADCYASNCESPDTDTNTITQGASLQLSERHLYTITENSEQGDSNGVISDYSSSSTNQRPVPVNEKSENAQGVAVSLPNICSCRLIKSTWGFCPLHASELYRSLPLLNFMTYPNTSCCETCTTHTKENQGWRQCKDKMSQTTPAWYMQSTMEGTCMSKTTTIQTTGSKGSNTDMTECSQNVTTMYQTNGKPCKFCNIPFTHLYNTDDGTKPLSVQRTEIEGTHYVLTHLPVDVGPHAQLLQLPNPNLQSDDCTIIFLPGHPSHSLIIKPNDGRCSHPSDSVGVQTDEHNQQRTDENGECNRESQLCGDTKGNVVQAPQRRAGAESNSIQHSVCGQSTSRQTFNRLVTPESCCEGSCTGNVDDRNTSRSVPVDMDNFSDDEDTVCLPSTTVSPTQGAEGSDSQHWTDIKNLILGTDRNAFPCSITKEEDEDDHPVQQIKDTKKKSVSWSDLSGSGALHTEMVFASDHNMYDSSQGTPNKINKNSLQNIISAEPCRHTVQSRQKTPQQQNQRKHNTNMHRSWSLLDLNELRKRKTEGKPDLAAFLREASALVHNLSQATCLLVKGCQLNITTSTPNIEKNDTINTVHNELWEAADSTSYGSRSLRLLAERSHGGPRSLPSAMHSKTNDNSTGTMKCNRNKVSGPKDCNIDTQMEIDQIHHMGKSKWFCDKHGMYDTVNLSHHSKLSTIHRHCCCSTYTFPIHRSAPHLHDCEDDQLCGQSLLIPPHCSPREYRQYLVAIRREIISASLPVILAKSNSL